MQLIYCELFVQLFLGLWSRQVKRCDLRFTSCGFDVGGAFAHKARRVIGGTGEGTGPFSVALSHPVLVTQRRSCPESAAPSATLRRHVGLSLVRRRGHSGDTEHGMTEVAPLQGGERGRPSDTCRRCRCCQASGFAERLDVAGRGAASLCREPAESKPERGNLLPLRCVLLALAVKP